MPKPPRNEAIDLLRGMVMALMALDHARDFVMGFRYNPTDLSTTTWALFFTRWVTHFCAPVFVLLAGTGAYLQRRRKSARELGRFLVTRGLWLVLLEVTVVRLGWMLNVNYHFVVLQVIWVIGWSMVLLAALQFLPPLWVGAFGLVLIGGHDLLDGTHAASFGSAGWLWHLVHERGTLVARSGMRVWVAYPLVPWVGVMAAGYALGALLDVEQAVRRKRLFLLGAGLCALFVVVRALDGYGDPTPWTTQPRAGFTLLSFLNCEKYPPSLCYLLMTLGPSLLVLALLDRPGLGAHRPARWMLVYGRVPLFYYLIHLFMLHLVTIAMMAPWLADPEFRARVLKDGAPGWSLGATYVAWATAVVALYPLCRWYMRKKERSTNAWLSYL